MKASRKRKRWLWIPFALVAIALVVVGCGIAQRRAKAADALDPADIATVFRGDLSASVSSSGQLLPQHDAGLVLGTQGKVEHVYVQAGDQVSSGDVLVGLESDDLERAVESARQALAIQEASLAEIVRPVDQEDLAAANAAVASAQAQLDDLLAGPSREELAQAEASLDSALARLEDLLAGPSAEDLAQAQANLVSARAALEGARARNAALDDQMVVAQNDIHNAQLAIDGARDAYNMLVWNKPEIAGSWGPHSPQAAALRNAQIAYDVAVANYALTEINANDSALRGAEAQVAQAEAALDALTEEKTSQIAAAEAQVARAEASLAALVDVKTAQIAGARAQLAQAQASVAKLLDGVSEEPLSVARAQVEQARISLEDALATLAETELTAPFDGTVTAVHVAVGEHVSGLAVELVDTDSLRVVLNVDEVDVGHIKVGQPALVTLETWPDRDLPGEVTSIAPKARNVAGIVTYEVQLSLDAGDLPVLSGMTANADILTAQRENVPLVPNRAVIAERKENKFYVNKVVDGELVKVEITIGMRDSAYTEVTSGLQEGDQVYTGSLEEGFDFMSGPPEGIR